MLEPTTFQEENWSGDFGDDYNKRNPISPRGMDNLYFENYGVSRSDLNKEFVSGINRDIKILEIGTNVGIQLVMLGEIGFKNLYGIEINNEAIESAKRNTKNINIIQGSALDNPFKDEFFDLVFTSGVLIHISPKDINKALMEIHRVSRKYIWGFEYYAPSYTEISYRGRENILWKADFKKIYLDNFDGLTVIRERKLKYLENDNIDEMFLLEKNG